MSAESESEILASPTYKSVGVDVPGLGGVTQKETSRICVYLVIPHKEAEVAGVCVTQFKMSGD